MHSNVTIKNVSWSHFSWPTLYIILVTWASTPLNGARGLYALNPFAAFPFSHSLQCKLNDLTITKVLHFRYLGIFLDDALTWSHHIDTINEICWYIL